MGLFGKLKDNFNHGGVKLDLQAAASVSMNDAGFPVTVTVTNGEDQRLIKSIKAEIVATSRSQNFNQPSGDMNSQAPITTQTVARADNTEQFTLAPGESRSVQLNIIMNAGAAVAGQLPQDSVMGQVAGAMQKLQSISEAMSGDDWTYNLRVSADVDGVAIDPAKEQPCKSLSPAKLAVPLIFSYGKLLF